MIEKLIKLGLLAGIVAAVVVVFPDLKRYLQIRQM
jgi:hypothetical protein